MVAEEDCGSGSCATARHRWTWPSNSRRTIWWRATGLAKPCLLCLSLSLSPLPHPLPLPRSLSSFLPRAQSRWRGGPGPESADLRPHARGAGSAIPSVASVPVPPVSPVSHTRVVGRSGPACWCCGHPGHFIDRVQ